MPRRRKKSKPYRRQTSHRKPPRPDTWNSPRGWCRFCGEEIIEEGKQNRRKNWHQPCAEEWVIMNNPKMAREHVFRREGGCCQGEGCTFQSPSIRDFHADHIRPLFEADGDLFFYSSKNLQLLCLDCHKNKTKSDMERFREIKDKP